MWKINVTSSLATKAVFDAGEVFVSLLYFRCWSQIMEQRKYKSEKCVISFGTSEAWFVNIFLRVTTANGFPIL